MANLVNQNTGYAEQDLSAVLDYSEDWSNFLIGSDTILSSVWAASSELVLNNQSLIGAKTSVWASGGVPGRNYRITNTVTTVQGRRDIRAFMLLITDITAVTATTNSTLFQNRSSSVTQLRRDILAMQSYVTAADLSDDYIYDKLLAAEADAARRLRVFLEPTTVFSGAPTLEEISAITTNKWVEESGYDYEPDVWNMEDWGYLALRNKLVSQIISVEFVYPSPVAGIFKMPDNWIRLDKKAGHLRFVPAGSTMSTGAMGSMMITMMAGGQNVPQMLKIRYIAGMADAYTDYPDLVPVVKRMAVLSILKDAFIAQSGSISADGLSQSSSLDMDKYEDSVNSALDHIKQSIHGIVMMVL